MDNDNFTTTGVTGLAMIVGQLRAELDRLRDDKDRDIGTLRTVIAELRSERETRELAILDVIATLTDAVGEVTTTATRPGSAGRKPSATEEESSAPLPMHNGGERPADYHKRVSAWARDNDQEQPPKPPTGPVANGRAYADKVARFYDAD